MLRRTLGVSVGWLGISMLADGVPALLLPHQLISGGRSDATTLGLTALVAIGVGALLQPIAGRISDRIGRFPVIAVGAGVACAGLVLIVAPGTAVPGAVIALAGASVAQAGHQALLPDRLPSRWRGRGGGLKTAFDVGGAFLAFVLLAALLGVGEVEGAAWLLGFVLVASFAASRLLLTAGGASPRIRSPLATDYRVDLAAHGPFVVLVVARFLFLLGVYVVGRFLLLFVSTRLGLDADEAAAQAGLALAVLALVTIVASIPAGWLADRAGRRVVMLCGGLLAAAGSAFLPLADGTALILAFGGLMATGSAAFSSASWAAMTDLIPAEEAGRFMGLAHIGAAGAAAMAGAFGILVDGAGFGVTFVVAAAASLAGGVLAWRAVAERGAPEVLIGSVEGAH